MNTESLRETQSLLLNAALELARANIPVFPCKVQDKSPWTGSGFKDASTNERQIKKWWWLHPDALIGAPTGIRFDVLDVDLAKHPEAGEWLDKAELPATRIHQTRSGGRHYLFKPFPGLTNTVSKLCTGIDTRVKGGYIIWWPGSGFTFQGEHLLAPWPDQLIAALKPVERPQVQRLPRAADSKSNPFTQLAKQQNAVKIERQVSGIIRLVLNAPVGERNCRLYWAGRRLAEMVEAELIDEDFSRDLLLEIGTRSGLEAKRCRKTIQSAFSNMSISQ